jgi:hypothetical protein
MPSSEVAVWLIEPEFVQQTVPPLGIVTSLGVKEKLAIVTVVSPAWQVIPDGLAEA